MFLKCKLMLNNTRSIYRVIKLSYKILFSSLDSLFESNAKYIVFAYYASPYLDLCNRSIFGGRIITE